MQNSEISLRLKAKSKTYYAKSLRPTTGWLLLVTACCILHACTTKSSDRSPKFQQYFVQGEQLYLRHCSNCHQKNGKGLGLIYPPLDSSDYMQNNFEDVLCLMRNGKSGVVIVNGKSFNQPMPGVPTLSDLEIAEIATYIYNSWSHKRGIVEVKAASQILSSCD
jgi:cytochrome c551